ncbi:arginyl-tRNA synthetase [Glaciihabitans sp. UYNi722]|uniref:arginyl-tRNA synthetase n=1 Tax=Glaciihabitans sp. UYNi722 TaxID=3156344 RepID=UPI0033999E1F
MKLFRSTPLVIAVTAVAAIALAGCVQTPKGEHSAKPSPSASSSPSAGSTPSSPTPSISPTVPAGGKPVTIGCDALVSRQAMYDFNANFGLDSTFSPKSGSAAATAVADGGVACNWTNQTSGDTITISVARPGVSKLGDIKSTAAKGTAASGYGDASYFSMSGDTGRVDVFTGEYWLVASSVYFAAATDAGALLTPAIGALK